MSWGTRGRGTSIALAVGAGVALVLPGAATAAPAPADPPPATATMRITPTKQVVTLGDPVQVGVLVETGGQSVKGAQFTLTFPDASLDCSSITGTNAFDVVKTKTCTANTAVFSVTRSKGFYPGSTAKVATLVFATTAKSQITIAVDQAHSFVIGPDGTTNILKTVESAALRIK